MTWFHSMGPDSPSLEMMPSRKDGNCCRCTPHRIHAGKKPFKAKSRVGGQIVGGGRVMDDGSPADPLTMEEWNKISSKNEFDVDKTYAALNSKYQDGIDVCGYCRKSLLEPQWRDGYEGEPDAEWCVSLDKKDTNTP